MTACEVNDAQAAHAKREAVCTRIVHEISFVVRSAMAHGRGHGADKRLRFRVARNERDSANAAHVVN
jgi:hypothetical protein